MCSVEARFTPRSKTSKLACVLIGSPRVHITPNPCFVLFKLYDYVLFWLNRNDVVGPPRHCAVHLDHAARAGATARVEFSIAPLPEAPTTRLRVGVIVLLLNAASSPRLFVV